MSFQEKKRLKFVTLTTGTSIGFEDRLAYSFLLAYRHGLTVARLARLSGIDRTRTLPKVLARLAALKLVKREGNRYLGEPSEIVRIQADRNGAQTWYERTCYLKLYLPSAACPLTKKQNAVYCLKLAGKDSTSLIAKLLNISRPTAINASRKLKERGLLDESGRPVPLPEEKLGWWEDNVRARNDPDGDLEELALHFDDLIQKFEASPHDWIAVHWWKIELNKFGMLCKQAGYKFSKVEAVLREVMERLRTVVPVARVFVELPKLAQRAEERTRANQRSGKFKGSSSFGLFKCTVHDLVRSQLRKSAAG
jgi:predicted transcriptional regulator